MYCSLEDLTCNNILVKLSKKNHGCVTVIGTRVELRYVVLLNPTSQTTPPLATTDISGSDHCVGHTNMAILEIMITVTSITLLEEPHIKAALTTNTQSYSYRPRPLSIFYISNRTSSGFPDPYITLNFLDFTFKHSAVFDTIFTLHIIICGIVFNESKT